MGHFAKAKTAPKLVLREFPVSKDALVPIGTPIYAQHFRPGQFLDIRGKSKGKGFQGAMKRHGYGGGYASHGQSVSTSLYFVSLGLVSYRSSSDMLAFGIRWRS